MWQQEREKFCNTRKKPGNKINIHHGKNVYLKEEKLTLKLKK